MNELVPPTVQDLSLSNGLGDEGNSSPIALELECVLSDSFSVGLERILEMICDKIIENQEGTNETGNPNETNC